MLYCIRNNLQPGKKPKVINIYIYMYMSGTVDIQVLRETFQSVLMNLIVNIIIYYLLKLYLGIVNEIRKWQNFIQEKKVF